MMEGPGRQGSSIQVCTYHAMVASTSEAVCMSRRRYWAYRSELEHRPRRRLKRTPCQRGPDPGAAGGEVLMLASGRTHRGHKARSCQWRTVRGEEGRLDDEQCLSLCFAVLCCAMLCALSCCVRSLGVSSKEKENRQIMQWCWAAGQSLFMLAMAASASVSCEKRTKP